MRPRTYILAVVLGFTFAATLSACQTSKNANPRQGNIQQKEPPEMISEGIKADYRIADELNKIPGLQGAAVLIKNGEAYVGAHVIGDEKHPDAYMKQPFGSYYDSNGVPNKSPLSGKGVPNQINGQTSNLNQSGVTQSGQPIPNTNQSPRTNTANLVGSATNNVDPELIRQIEQKVRSMAPNVNRVHITGKFEDVNQLQGYARYIQDGGSMQQFANDFNQTIKRIFPAAKP
ncbi:YhcN/YlaJ family sporulation lipoprotein [Effusibacillus dendaii]|uniref:Uncharacterized protein n=1 Tax=Effusibacillus dendaii TaxID=2743772 RepID=A0A7I8DA52_9BACL|nr:YhcN/YlaJ family sporulation lipoprotein [Effusibacillus dendaii]BCJ86975.1 hypothetical protein skT53_19600 [Effusibacillus dendaii]